VYDKELTAIELGVAIVTVWSTVAVLVTVTGGSVIVDVVVTVTYGARVAVEVDARVVLEVDVRLAVEVDVPSAAEEVVERDG
jgi:hypothetical protein